MQDLSSIFCMMAAKSGWRPLHQVPVMARTVCRIIVTGKCRNYQMRRFFFALPTHLTRKETNTNRRYRKISSPQTIFISLQLILSPYPTAQWATTRLISLKHFFLLGLLYLNLIENKENLLIHTLITEKILGIKVAKGHPPLRS